MFARWLHNIWKFFWTVVLVLLATAVIVGGSVYGLLQLEVTQRYISDRIERDFREEFGAQLDIGSFEGHLPFQFQMGDIRLIDTSRGDTLVNIRSMNARLDIWSLLQNKISITGFTMNDPEIRFMASDRTYTLVDILRKRGREGVPADTVKNRWIERVEVIAPRVEISGGKLYVERFFNFPEGLRMPEPFEVSEMNAVMFLELSEQQRFLDIEHMNGTVAEGPIQQFSVTGQVYNNKRFLEFNGFNIFAGNSELVLNGEIDGVDLYRENLSGQLLNAGYTMDLSSNHLVLAELSRLVPAVPSIREPLEFSLQAQGKIDSIWVDRFTFGVGQSHFNINGIVENIRSQDVSYDFILDNVSLYRKDVEVFTGPLQEQFRVLENLTVRGHANGTADSLVADLSLNSPFFGHLQVDGFTLLKSPFSYQASLTAEHLNIAPLLAASGIDTTSLNFDATLNGVGYSLRNGVMEFTAAAYNSVFGPVEFDRLDLSTSLVNGFLEQEYTYVSGDQRVSGTGWADFSSDEMPVSLKGNARNINLADYAFGGTLVPTSLNFDYNFEVRGMQPDQIHGRANLDIKQSVINGDTVRAHQLYMDLDEPGTGNRNFRLTSSLVDININGTIDPANIQRQFQYWSAYFDRRYREEILLEPVSGIRAAAGAETVKSLTLEGNFQAKDISLVQKYWPEFPNVQTDSRIDFNVNADGERLLLSADVRADTFNLDNVRIDRSNVQLTASFRHSQLLREFSSIDFRAGARNVNTGFAEMDSLQVNIAMKQDSISFNQTIGRISDQARFSLALQSSLGEERLRIRVTDFFLGNDLYGWRNEQTPVVQVNSWEEIEFERFRFRNREEFIELTGRIGPQKMDSLKMDLENVQLNRISDLFNGRVTFSGIMNGRLVSSALTSSPTLQGSMTVNRFMLQDRTVGDVQFQSTYNQERNRFDTRARIITDSTKYSAYLDENDNIGQNILLDGYFVPPDPDVKQDTVYHFDVNFNEVDMWVVPLITHKVFDEMEGKATGSGYLAGNMEDFDFHADFQAENVFAKPQFLNTNYFINGHVILDRERGVVLDSLDITDTRGGTGRVWGSVDLNDFSPITYLDLSIRMNNLQFLNNSYDPDVPFYGTVAGTGLLRVTGPNTGLLMRTEDAIRINNDSNISIPLLDQTELQESNRFIRFVDEFGKPGAQENTLSESQEGGAQLDKEALEEVIENLTFSERFDLDLLFNAPNNINVNLIFDPVTDEILTAQGTGQLRITMQDENVQMFGHYDIRGGSYRFVSGDIFSRRLDLESGGTIAWEGDPDNARLNINAVFHARPSISSLTGGAGPADEPGRSQQIPVDLVLEIRGTVSSVENNYYFSLPNTMDITSNSTLQFAINQINRDEQQKLLQATSILISGQFIPTQSYDNATSSLTQTLTRGSTVLNPLLSNQVISPLLSNQINTLLNSDVSRFDIDFNLNAYNEIDLGIALRLYNDRLILRREGQITGGGPESTFGERLGDLNATYRINNNLSLTAFHRQDQALGSIATSPQTGDVTPSVDGVGLEAEVNFNTWKELRQRIAAMFRRILGIGGDDEAKKTVTNEAEIENL